MKEITKTFRVTYEDADISNTEKKYIPVRYLKDMLWFLFHDDPQIIETWEKHKNDIPVPKRNDYPYQWVWNKFNQLILTYLQSHGIRYQCGGQPLADEFTERFIEEYNNRKALEKENICNQIK